MAAGEGEEAGDWERKYEALDKEYKDFQRSSAELEAELEREVTAASAEVERLANALASTQLQLEDVREAAAAESGRLSTENLALHAKLQEAQARIAALEESGRRLETENDDLQRQVRVSEHATEDFQTRLESALEENIMLQVEVDELTGGQAEHAERLREQLRDVKAELAVLKARQGRSPAHARKRSGSPTPPPPRARPRSASVSKSPKETAEAAQRLLAAGPPPTVAEETKGGGSGGTGGTVCYLVESAWMDGWKRYILGSGERPGPADNSKLLNEKGRLRKGLRVGEDYVTVLPSVWSKLYSLYGGVPVRGVL